jgi:hypothetical protein
MKGAFRALLRQPHFRIYLFFQLVLLLSTASMAYLAVERCLRECEDEALYTLPCLSGGEAFCCLPPADATPPAHCQPDCLPENNHCGVFMVAAAINLLLLLLLLLYLLFLCRKQSAGGGRSQLSSTEESSSYRSA